MRLHSELWNSWSYRGRLKRGYSVGFLLQCWRRNPEPRVCFLESFGALFLTPVLRVGTHR